MWSTSIEVAVAVAPAATYGRLLHGADAHAGSDLLQRLGTILLVIGVAVSTMAVQRVTVGLVTTIALSWSFALGVQAAIGALIIATAPSRRVWWLTALSLWFAAHLPYSLWMLLVSILMATSRYASAEFLIASALLPAAWTFVLVSAFSRVVLQTSRSGARWRAAAHQVVIWAVALGYVAWAAGGWFRILGSVVEMSS